MNHLERRNAVVNAARGELGAGRLLDYWRDALGPSWRGPYPQHWCGAFALWCLHQAGLAPAVLWVVGKGFCEVERLPKTTTPEPGDIIYIAAPFQHHAVFVAREGDIIVSVDGNQGGVTPVRLQRRKRSSVTCFYSIAPFLTAAELEPADSRVPTRPAPPPTPPPIAYPTLRRGDKGEGVRALQRALGIPSDGEFGPKTEAAVRDFQGLHALRVDGIAGHKTWEALGW